MDDSLAERYRLMIEYSSDAISLTGKDGRFLLLNSAAVAAFGVPAQEVVGKTPDELNKQGVYHGSTIKKTLQTKEPATAIIDHLDYRRLSTSRPILDEDGELQYILTNSRKDDIFNEYMELLQKETQMHLRYQKIATYLSQYGEGDLIYESPQMQQVVELCTSIAPTGSTVSIIGESGVGKELIARFIHNESRRKEEAFIPVNCSAIPAELFESELFGYRPGAFTGANRKGKLGLVQMADKGTLFLDEIGELPLQMQSKLLRFIESKEICPVGGIQTEAVDVRIITATNRDLLSMMRAGTFREDLYYRLMVLPVHIPPLRNRPDDIRIISTFFLQQFSKKYEKDLSLNDTAMELLMAYPWRGNVRELRNAMERLVLLAQPWDVLATLRTILSIQADEDGGPLRGGAQIHLGLSLKEATLYFQADYMEATIRKYHGNLGDAAEALGVHRTTLYRKQSISEHLNRQQMK